MYIIIRLYRFMRQNTKTKTNQFINIIYTVPAIQSRRFRLIWTPHRIRNRCQLLF